VRLPEPGLGLAIDPAARFLEAGETAEKRSASAAPGDADLEACFAVAGPNLEARRPALKHRPFSAPLRTKPICSVGATRFLIRERIAVLAARVLHAAIKLVAGYCHPYIMNESSHRRSRSGVHVHAQACPLGRAAPAKRIDCRRGTAKSEDSAVPGWLAHRPGRKGGKSEQVRMRESESA
jgi:hypothetical protein